MMGIAISPRHVMLSGFETDRSLDQKIELFLARVDGWHLEVADRCINGWKNEAGEQCIRATFIKNIAIGIPGLGWVSSSQRVESDSIPDSGWAVLQIVMYYFELIGLFKFFRASDADDPHKLFETGLLDVFPFLREYGSSPVKRLYRLRNGLYHKGVKGGDILISARPLSPIECSAERLEINPHLFVCALRRHLQEYGNRLLDPSEKELRARFEAAYHWYYSD
jgi:hypothetical protein